MIKWAHFLIFLSMLDQSQSLLSEQGSLATLEHFKGLYRISLLSPIQPGQWKLHTKSDGHLTFNVIGKRWENKLVIKQIF